MFFRYFTDAFVESTSCLVSHKVVITIKIRVVDVVAQALARTASAILMPSTAAEMIPPA